MFWNKKNILIVLGMSLTLAVAVANADYIFGTPTVIIPNQDETIHPSVSSDGLSMYIDSPILNVYAYRDLMVYTRETIHDDWSGPENLGPTINRPYSDQKGIANLHPSISRDGLSLYFVSNRQIPYNNRDIYVSTRATLNDDWSEPVNLGSTINGPYDETDPSISSDGLSLYFSSSRPDGWGSLDIYVSTRATLNDPWSEPENLGLTVNSSSWDAGPDISNDGLKLFFTSERPGGYGGYDTWVTKRATIEDDWGAPVNLGPIVNTSDNEISPCISADDSILYWFYFFGSGRALEGDLRQVPIYTIIDLNGSGFFDIDDLVIIIENWDTNEPSCDIAPAPFGNGIVDKKDLEIFMSYWEQVVNVTAYWKLDETEGAVAYDSSGYYCDADVIGDPNWQPEDGMVDGAIEFDGINNFIITPFTLNPADESFSVFAWIKGGLPGQVILSQADGMNLLSVNPSDGCLMTDKGTGRGACELISEVVITDGDWHLVGFTWDGDYRILYVDDVIAAIDTQPGLPSSEGGLYIGAGKDLEPGTVWWGMIDDVRIYDRVITP